MRLGPATTICLGVFCGVLLGPPAAAYSGGITGRSGNPATGGSYCISCHGGGVVPTVTLGGPTKVAPGSANTYTLRISGGQRRAGGFNVSTSAGTLAANDPGTFEFGNEVTHEFPREVDAQGDVVFRFLMTAPSAQGTVTLYGAGNSVNLDGDRFFDNADKATLTVNVEGAAAGPGEASGDGLPALLVTAFDAATQDMTLAYGVPCAATDHAVYYGPLAQVASYAWSGQRCAIGASGTLAGFDPGPGSWFFVVVANDGAREGSFGRDAAGSERPPKSPGCGPPQQLANRCDPTP